MVAKITTGKNIRGALHYNENKLEKGEAEILLASNFSEGEELLDFHDKLSHFRLFTDKNKRTKTNAVHISLNFSPDDKLDEEKLKDIAIKYMEGIGFGEQPYLVYQHFDAAHPHIHVLTTNIREDGKRIETHNLGKNQSELARKSIEERFRLIKAEDQKKEKAYMLRPVSMGKAQYGQSETKVAIANIVTEVMRTYKYTSLAEFNAALRQFNVSAYRGEPESRMYQEKGLVYSISDGEGNRLGVPFKASSIHSKPTLQNLEKRFGQNKERRKQHKARAVKTIEHILTKPEAKDLNGLKEALSKKGIHAVFRTNDQGWLYGVTFVDNVTRSVFNGSDLGKHLSANALHRRFNVREEVSMDADQKNQSPDETVTEELAQGRSLVEEMIQGLFDEVPGEFLSENRPRRKKKKRRK
ncbi:relaxase/mobilization nuclease domain-containing protein [Belliella kenyensis]|uniref:Relaxase/mobilization nuclease domain-containing protein n=1 Tax=Belliella kenyensis TaxID=1472724 RepID=A0ABV8EN00_9BACT|nr:relaxase/mobilization nuclease domain-containing protein [Belliella kenyensis]MCH7400775.1 relaxase/mobilization nuclease domain-containing protein [Belliella kenyensis]MDN3601937.1 relaxase/mobilization nuclease domain-containing protein [Belliella kenyensis]